jgi:dihydroorotate dehydrogenase electron transfer subunit
MIFLGKAKLIKNIEVIQKYYKILLYCPRIAKIAKPGQFVEFKVSDNYEPLLRRPFSIHRVKGNNIEISYEVLGKGTDILSQRKPGGYLNVIGPLGNGFNYRLPLPAGQAGVTDYRLPILVAGGMGVAPLVFLAEKLAELRTPNYELRTMILIGAKTKNQILCEKEFKKLGCTVKISTDDGSRGFKGKVTELLRDILASSIKLQAPSKKTTKPAACSLQPAAVIYACGPKPMLEEISRISCKHNIRAQISLEEHMACGTGICFGCAVKTKYGYKRICKEGPVFNADEIIW